MIIHLDKNITSENFNKITEKVLHIGYKPSEVKTQIFHISKKEHF
jgi:hypothetical protein